MAGYKIDTTAGGTGTFTIATPNSNTDRTLTLPDAAGELLTTTGDGSGLTGIQSGIIEMDRWYLNTNLSLTSGSTPLINLSQNTDYLIGSGMSVSSGVFTFPSTGWWKIEWLWHVKTSSGGADRLESGIDLSTNSGATYSGFAYNNANIYFTDGWSGATISTILKVSSTSTYRVKFVIYVSDPNITAWAGNNYNAITFRKLGDIA
jgi:hypothetical protein